MVRDTTSWVYLLSMVQQISFARTIQQSLLGSSSPHLCPLTWFVPRTLLLEAGPITPGDLLLSQDQLLVASRD